MPNLPEMIGPYRIIGRLGQGAMGTVYRAEDPRIERQVAIKTIQFNPDLDPQSEAHARARFIREARSAGSLSHPNIVTVYHLGEHEGQSYLVMELVDGSSLSRVLRANQDPDRLPELLRGLQQIAPALDYAHQHGVIHRDIKPANILVSNAGKFKVADFGIAKVLAATELTATGALIGTPQYIAPESLRGLSVSAASDQYSLAIVAYEVLTRRVPFEAESMEALLFQILLEPPPPVGNFNPALNPALDEVLRQALAKDPAARFGSCTEFMDQLLAAMTAKHVPRPPEQNAPNPPEPPHQQQPQPPPPRPVVPVMPSPFLSEKQKTPLWKPVGYAVLLALILVFVIFYFVEKSKVKANGYRVPDSIPQIQLPKDLIPVPTVDELPPVIPAAANPKFLINTRQFLGPQKPKAQFRISSSERSSLTVVLVGGDSTLYVGDDNEKFWAVRDGRALWGFEKFGFRNIRAFADGRLYLQNAAMLNANGEGGMLRGDPPLPPFLDTPDGIWVERYAYGGSCEGKYFPLDRDCENATTDSDGRTYLITVTKNLYAFDADRKRLWTAQMPCRSSTLMVADQGTVVFACQGSSYGNAASLIGVKDGKIAWTFKTEKELVLNGNGNSWSMVVDRNMTMYLTDEGTPTHLYAISRDGQQLWKYDLGEMRFHHLQLDSQGRLFLSGTHWRDGVPGSSLICLADSPQ